MRINIEVLRGLTITIVLSFSTVAFAQNAIEEVLVTATKRVESIQDVPVSVNSISGAQIESLGITDMEDLSLYVPNFEINSASVLPNLYMRGLGSGATHSIEQSAGRFIDGVYIGRAAINLHGFMDIGNVEVLRGPQGTLFGKNTVAGALIVNTADPTDTFESGIRLSVSDYSTTGGNREVQAYFSGPLSENLNARLAIKGAHEDGFYKNRLEGPGGPERTDAGVRLKLAWSANDRTSVNLKLEHNEFEAEGPDTAEVAAIGAPSLARFQVFSPNFTPELDWIVDADCTDITANRDTTEDGAVDTEANIGSFCPSRDQDTQNATLEIEHDIAGGTITSITAYQQYDYQHKFFGVDMGVASTFRARRNEEFEGFSQELRFTSPESDRFDYIVGAYYEDTDLSRFQNSSFNFVTLFGNPQDGRFFDRFEPWSQQTTTMAMFGQTRWHIKNNISLILGGRYASEDKDFQFEQFFADYGTNNRRDRPPGLTAKDDRSESKFTGSATVQWHASDAAMLYANYSQGHKSGGFSDRIESADADFEYDEENVDSYELGLKSTLLNGTLVFNVALFMMDIEGLQLATQIPGDGPPIFSVTNAADSTSQGVEVDTTWQVHDVWTLGASLAYTDASYDSFPGAECFAGASVTGCDPDKDKTTNLADLPLIFAPDMKAALFADFNVPDMLGAWDVGGRVDYIYSDEFYTDISYHDKVLADSYSLWNVSLRFTSPDDRVTISFIGKNLSEEAYCAWCIPSGPNILGAMNPPRELALQVTMAY